MNSLKLLIPIMLVLGCGGTDVNGDIAATSPQKSTANVWTGERLTVTFSEAMDPATLNTSTFTLAQGSTAISGAVSYDASSKTATFVPAAPLGASLLHSATVSTGATSLTGKRMKDPYTWTFTTAAPAASAPTVNLQSAANYAILAKTAISTVPASQVTGDIGLSPAAESYITGFSLTATVTTFSKSAQVIGNVYSADRTSPTPATMTTAVADMATAFTDSAGRAPDFTEVGAGDISGLTLTHGVYKWSSGLLLTTDVHLSGTATDVWIFQIAQNLTVSSATQVILSGGALAKNVFWQVSGAVDLGTTSHLEGNILCQTAIAAHTGSSVNGRLLAQSAVSIDGSTIIKPAP
jgi:hypothetical protein